MILGIIPARGGSKTILKKNIKPCHDRPLIAWTITAALESNLLDDFVVSTEDQEIRNVSAAWGAKVMDRPGYLAMDHTPTMPVLIHVLKVYPEEVDTVVLLQCTSPIRHAGLIDDCISTFSYRKADSLVTGRMREPLQFWGDRKVPRQELKSRFWDDGNIYIVKADLIRQGKYRGKKNINYILSEREGIDIDTKFDFWVAEKVLEDELRKSV